MKKIIFALIAIAILSAGLPKDAKALVLPPGEDFALTYGDFYSYSLPVLAYFHDLAEGGGTGPGNPYYVPSSPGHLADSIVIATGSKGSVVNNYPGMDDAYATPNSSGLSEFYTETAVPVYGVADPDPVIPNDQEDTWDSSLEAFIAFLGEGNTPQFFFNNNETDSGDGLDQDLKVYGTVRLWSSTTAVDDIVFELISHLGTGLGEAGGDPGDHTYDGSAPTDGEYVISGGDMCFDGGGVPVPCSDPTAIPAPSFPHNLGANQAAYVVVAPELDEILLAWDASTGPYSDYDMLSIDLRLREINNGYEQAFVQSSRYFAPVPEPSTWLLMALGLLALPFARKLRK